MCLSVGWVSVPLCSCCPHGSSTFRPNRRLHDTEIHTRRKSFSSVGGGMALSVAQRAGIVALVIVTVFLTSDPLLGGGGAGVYALSCAACDRNLCPNTTDCPGGLVLDICLCCHVCAHMVNESCGGPFGILGKCDRNLHCFIRPTLGAPITGDEPGVCKEFPAIDCNDTDCPPVYDHNICPPDSYLVSTHNHKSHLKSSSDEPFHEQYDDSDDFDDQQHEDGDGIARTVLDNDSLAAINGENDLKKQRALLKKDSLLRRREGVKHNATSDTASSFLGVPADSEHLADAKSDSIEPEQTSYCVCNTSSCEVPTCAAGYARHMVQNATGMSGACCDVYQCRKSQECQDVICPPYVENLCPGDSVRLPPVWTSDKCCELQQGCTCPAVEECQPVWCPVGFQVQVISRASRLPGSCCDRFRCVNESGLTCSYNGQEMKNGEKWNIDKCKTCECRDGLNRCRDKACVKLSCTWMVIPEGECCPVCRGCVSDSGDLYNNSAVWRPNDCTTCQCKDGHAQCQAEMCEVQCSNPKHVPGQCCPVCPDLQESSLVKSEKKMCPDLDGCSLSCPQGLIQDEFGCSLCQCKQEICTLDCQFGRKSDVEGNPMCECQLPDSMCPHWDPLKCDIKCEYGYKRDRGGCPKCRCNKCPLFNCTKRCVHGHLINDEGCAVCKCKELPLPELSNSNTELVRSEGKSCMSRRGARHINGESWNDGCRVCYCHNGHEMCSLISCPAPHCLNPVFRVGDCCPSCPGLTVVSPNGMKEMCQSSQGHYYVEGETWQLDQCTHCVCHGGSILCETPSCPPVLCHHPIKLKNECCAICRGDELGLLPSTVFRQHCRSHTGMLYKHGESWQSTPCQSCVCQDGQIHCYNQMCALVNCQKTILRKGQCCPTCVDTESPQFCSYKGVVYDSGEKWEGDNCMQCICLEGKTECFPLNCPALHCSVLVRKKGVCCAQCYDLSKHNLQSSDKKNQFNVTDGARDESQDSANIIGFSVMGVFLVVLAVVIVLLVYRIMSNKHKSKYRMRPKSTNLELQGQMPFLPGDNQTKAVNMEKQYLEKLCPAITSEQGKGDRASNHYTEMVFPDKNTDTLSNGHFSPLKT